MGIHKCGSKKVKSDCIVNYVEEMVATQVLLYMSVLSNSNSDRHVLRTILPSASLSTIHACISCYF